MMDMADHPDVVGLVVREHQHQQQQQQPSRKQQHSPSGENHTSVDSAAAADGGSCPGCAEA